MDNDGDVDYVLGNLGENYKYKASDEEPFEIYASDLDKNGISDIVLGYYLNKKLYPVRGFQCSSEQIPDLKQKFDSYEAFGKSDVFAVYGVALEDAINIKANNFSSCILWNNESKFELEKLPVQAQLAPIQDLVLHDINNDGFMDIIAAGNWFVSEIETPRADNGTGLVLLNNKDRGFETMPLKKSGFFAKGDVRHILKLKCPNDYKIIIANNNSNLESFSFN